VLPRKNRSGRARLWRLSPKQGHQRQTSQVLTSAPCKVRPVPRPHLRGGYREPWALLASQSSVWPDSLSSAGETNTPERSRRTCLSPRPSQAACRRMFRCRYAAGCVLIRGLPHSRGGRQRNRHLSGRCFAEGPVSALVDVDRSGDRHKFLHRSLRRRMIRAISRQQDCSAARSLNAAARMKSSGCACLSRISM
jgi:hypothetical protein